MSEPDGGDPRKRIVLYVILLFFVGGLIALLFRGKEADSPQPEPYDYIAAKAEVLGNDPARIIEFVSREIGVEDYDGVLKGPVGTLFSGAGNDEDRSSLLAALLRRTESEVRFARSDTTWVQQRKGGEWEDLLQSVNTASWTGETLPSERYHELVIALRRTHKDGLHQRALELRTADLAPHPIALRFDQNKAILQVAGRENETTMDLDGSEGETLSLVFSHRGPKDESPFEVTREIFTRRYPTQEVRFDVRDRHLITVAPWTLPPWIYEKELELLKNDRRKFTDPHLADAYRLSLSYLKQSDQATRGIAEHFKTKCYFTRPRIIISSVTFDEGSDSPSSVALDLRANTISIEDHAARAATGVTRSTYEAALEADFISRASGRPAFSALPVFQQLFDRRRSFTPERLRLYASSLERLLEEARPGAELTFRTQETHSLTFMLIDQSRLKITTLSPALANARQAWPGGWTHVKEGAEVSQRAVAEVALELELLFGPAINSAVDYRPTVQFDDSLEDLISPDTRIFLIRKDKEGQPIISLEYQIQAIDGDVRYESIDYWDEITQRRIRSSEILTVPEKSVEESHLLSRHYSNSLYRQGGMFLFASRQVRTELKTKGETVVRYQNSDGSLSEELKLFLTEQKEESITVNNRERKVSVLFAAGSYLKDNPSKKPWDEVADIKSGPPWEITTNKWKILDNEKFPLIGIPGSIFQTAIPGRVTSAQTGLGISDVRVTVEGTNSQGSSWADGRLLLPVVKKAFATFWVTASHPGYAPLRTSIDFTKPDAFPLNLTLTPRPNPDDFIWITHGELDSSLPTIETTDRVRDFIRTALTEQPHLLALVPKQRPLYGGSDTHAWILFDPDHFQFVGVTEDGLHGSSVAGGMVKDWAKNAVKAGFGKGSPYEMQTGAINAFAGYIASWYAYSAGKLDVLSQMMDGKEFDDVGHASAMKFALDFLKGMQALNKGLGGFAAKKAGYRNEQFEAGFMEGLKFFESNPVFRGQ